MQTLKYGSKGEDVKTLQKLLNLQVDGIFGKNTEESVKKFQLEHNLLSDGIVGQNTWRVLNNNVIPNQNKRKINDIILHCTATKDGTPFTVEQIRKVHKANGWSDIGYHWVIYLDGSINQGRSETLSGAHCEGHNANSIGISYVGGLDKNGNPKDTRTKTQKEAMYKKVDELLKKYNLTLNNVHCHNSYTNKKACPCFKREDFLKEFNNYKNNKTK